jgi:hypothetical protein
MHLNTTRILGKDPTNVVERTAAETEARAQVLETYLFLKNNIAGCEKAELIGIAAETGIRESRRIVGRYEITEQDILAVRKFDDSIARGTYEIDIHNPSGTGTRIAQIPDGDFYTIPYRATVPLSVTNLLVAGRPISSAHEAHAAFRIMPITACVGEAAGIAATLAVRGGIAAIDVAVPELHKILTAHGALY